MSEKKDKKKRAKEEIEKLIEDLQKIKGVKVLPLDPDTIMNMLRQDDESINEYFRKQSEIASAMYEFFTVPPKREKRKMNLAEDFMKDAVPLSNLFSAVIGTLESLSKRKMDTSMRIQLSMLFASAFLKDKHPIAAHVAYWRLIRDDPSSFEFPSLFKDENEGGDSDTSDKTYI